MKKITLIIIALFLICNSSIAQDATYFILTSKANTTEGVLKEEMTSESVYKYKPVYFSLVSQSKGVSELFYHVNYNITELAKIRAVKPNDQMEIKTMTQAQVNAVNPIDIDVLLSTKDKQQVRDFCKQYIGKKVYIIDRSTKKRKNIFSNTYMYTVHEVEYVYAGTY